MKDAFSRYHPIINLIYFLMVLGFASFLRHPVCLGISLISSAIYATVLTGRKHLWRSLRELLPMSVLIIIINPLVNHQGVTILGYFPGGNPFTLEAIIYGVAAAAIICSLMQWFVCWNQIMTTDKLIYLFGRIAPSLSLVISMSLQFIPRYSRQLHKIAEANGQLNRSRTKSGLLGKLQSAIRILSMMTTWAIEHAVETAQSMKGRGYGLPGRTAFSIYQWCKQDSLLLVILLLLGAVMLAGEIRDVFYWSYIPVLSVPELGAEELLIFGSYMLLTILPLILNGKEEMEWKKSFD